ncbi:MAG: putative PEP-binding protein [Cyanobacteriota bacterium]|nr:putative PEP-binding protein [Cyanobacteriota bacterium]
MPIFKFVNNIYWLDRIKSLDRNYVGDKALNLAYMMEEGYPVLPGFVIPPELFWEFIREIDWSDPLFADFPNSSLHINVEDYRQLQAIARGIRFYITTAPLPSELFPQLESALSRLDAEVLVFRPSLTYPSIETNGILETTVCEAKIDAFASQLKKVWAEYFSAKSLFYWQQKQVLTEDLKPSVLVQYLPEAIASGNLKADNNILEIEATFGFDFSLVRGEISPDYYQINLETKTAMEKRLGNKAIAYNLHRQTGTLTPKLPLPESLEMLQIYLLSEREQDRYSLEENDLEELIELSKKLTNIWEENFYLEWILSNFANNKESQFYISLVRTLNNSSQRNELKKEKPVITTTKLSRDSSGILQGLAAAPGRVKAIATIMTNFTKNNQDLMEGKILVVRSVIPAYFPLITQAVGIIAEKGGMTSHGAILARELGIPAVVGVKNATQLIEDGEAVLIDGNAGKIYLIEREEIMNEGAIKAEEKTLVTDFSFPISTQLLVNLSQLHSIETVKDLPVDGVGLLRSELMTVELLENEHPLIWLRQGRQSELVELMVDRLSQFAAAFSPRPVFYRSLDLLPVNPLNHTSSDIADDDVGKYSDRVLGDRGTFSYMLDSAIFDLEIKVIERVYELGYNNVHLILPFVRSLEEFVFCRGRIEEMWKGKPSSFEIWIMAEVPSVLFLLPEYVEAGVRGICIGTNDLTQLLFGANREQEQIATALPPSHPAVMRAIKQLISMANTAGIPCSICGDAPALYPQIIDDLVRWGITSISVNPNAVEQTYRAIARAEHRLILDAVRRQNNLDS